MFQNETPTLPKHRSKQRIVPLMSIKFPPDFRPCSSNLSANQTTTPQDEPHMSTPCHSIAPLNNIVPLMSIKFPPDFRPTYTYRNMPLDTFSLKAEPRRPRSHSHATQDLDLTPRTGIDTEDQPRVEFVPWVPCVPSIILETLPSPLKPHLTHHAWRNDWKSMRTL